MINEMPKTIKRHLDWTNTDIDIPTTTIWQKGKTVWNIGKHNEQAENGFVIVTHIRPNSYDIIPETLEYVYVGSAEIAKAIMDISGYCEITPHNIKKLERLICSKKAEYIKVKARKVLDYFKENTALIGD
jgi:hypothetical protein